MGREYRVRDFNEMQSRQRDGAWAGVFLSGFHGEWRRTL